MKDESIDDKLCPASYKVFGIVKSEDYVCMANLMVCHAPRCYEGCEQYKTYKSIEAVRQD